MHASSFENMQWCRDCFLQPASGLVCGPRLTVLDVGAADYNGSYRELFAEPTYRYLAADISSDKSVDVVIPESGEIPLANDSIDVVISGQALEHAEFFWEAFAEMVRVSKESGLIFLIVPSAGPVHRYPVDCYRFYPDSMAALAKYTKCFLIHHWMDERGPWNDLVGVFTRSEKLADRLKRFIDAPPRPQLQDPGEIPAGPPEDEKCRGQRPYLDVLQQIHSELGPRHYLEIGVRHGRSLRLAACEAVGVDPCPEVSVPLPDNASIIETSSDVYFKGGNSAETVPDLAFIDGCHWFEFALRDFMNVERLVSPTSLVVIDDIFPNSPAQAKRDRTTRAWTGDVWKLHEILKKVRPDLWLLPLDTYPSGLLLVAGCNSGNRHLWNAYNPLVRKYLSDQFAAPTEDRLARHGAIAPDSELIACVAQKLAELRSQGRAPTSATVLAELNAITRKLSL